MASLNEKKNSKFVYDDFFKLLRNKGVLNPSSVESRNYIFNQIVEAHNEQQWNLAYADLVKAEILKFSIILTRKWSQCNRSIKKFVEKNESWLQTVFELPPFPDTSSSSSSSQLSLKRSSVGRPQKNFQECTERAKRQKVSSLINSHCLSELAFSTATQLNKCGKRSAANLVKEIVKNPDDTKAFQVKQNYIDSKPIPYSNEEALAFLIDNDLTKTQYVNIRLGAKNRNCDIYPSYEKIMEAKQACYPLNMHISEYRCEIPLQNLLDHTASRISAISSIEKLQENMDNFEIIYKWGCDGSSGHSQYKQKFGPSAPSSTSDSDLFLFSLVPLQFRCTIKEDNFIIWKNPRPSSTTFCRPIKFIFAKETAESTLKEVKDIETQIEDLNATETYYCNAKIQIRHTLIFSMIDGKVCNSMTGTSSQTCYICGCTPKNSNDIDKVLKMPINSEVFKFGLSTLHAWIRFFECLLHVSYRLPFQSWQVRSDQNKKIFNARKTEIQNKFRSEMGLLVDVVLQGRGTTNDGNTARKFFKNATKSAEITQINLELIQRFGNILSVLASGHEINTDAFKVYGVETAKLFVSLYPWYNMPASVHKILLHGAEVIEHALLPIGELSEEAQECRNKDYKTWREHHTRKDSRLHCNEDLLHILLVSSDPLISSLRNIKKKELQELPEACKKLLK